MINPIVCINEVEITGSVTLGLGPGQQTPPYLLLCNGSGAITVTLPPIKDALPVPPATPQGTVGLGGQNYYITIVNLTANAITILAAGSDSILGTIPTMTAAGAHVTLKASSLIDSWIVIG